MKALFKKIILEFHENNMPKTIERNINIPLHSKKIVSIIGPRRAGKTHLMYELIKKIPDITNTIYINFEDERFNIRKENLQEIIEAYLELYPEKKEPYIFFDEIQEITGWEKFVRRIYDTITTKIFITGSSAKLLSKEIATSLRGRTITYELYPLSFKEYIIFNNNKIKNIITTREKAKAQHLFGKYMETGGFPELSLLNKEIHERIIKDYTSTMLLKDIIDRHELRNSIAIKAFFERNITNYAKELSITKIYNELKSLQVKVTRESLYEYINYFEEAYATIPLINYTSKISKKEIKKIYLIDHAIANITKFKYSPNKGRILENIVFIQLKRKEKEIFYHKEKKECDFIIKEGMKIINAIQVCYDLNEDNKKREYEGLLEAMKKHSLKKGLLLTNDQEEEIILENKKIIIKPVWKWLLE